jgi:prepilin-type N-terminal cleavage/methylation domain-containing protein
VLLRRRRPLLPGAAGDEAGWTLIEMMVVVLLLAIVLGVMSEALVSVQSQVQVSTQRSQGNDQVRVAIDQLDDEIRSGNVFYDPATLNDPANGIYPHMALIIYTQAQANTLNPGDRCVEWRIYSQQLEFRYWAPYWTAGQPVSAWQVVATNVVNQTVSPQVNAFTLDPTAAYGSRLLDVDILTQPPNTLAHPTETRASITGRDTQYGYPQTVCSSVPPYS